jgi:hypothetical protein
MSSFSGGLRNEMFSVLINSDGEKNVIIKSMPTRLKERNRPTNAIGKVK